MDEAKPFPVAAYVLATNALGARHYFCGVDKGVMPGTFCTVISTSIFDAMRIDTEAEAKMLIADHLGPAWSISEVSKVHASRSMAHVARRLNKPRRRG